MNLADALILGIIQGLTEFLPVSSSAHLVLGKVLLSVHEHGIVFEVFVHFGTLLSVLLVYRRDIYLLIQSMLKVLRRPGLISGHYRQDREFRFLVYILAGSVPAGVIGILFNDPVERAFNDPVMVSGMLLVTGVILLLTRFIKPPQRELTFTRAILIGCAQAMAIMPGISRSGSTISMALYLGISREEAARYSFLLAVPVILGATLLKLVELLRHIPPSAEILDLAAGTLISFVSGYAAIKLLLMFIRRGKLDYFAWYCFAVGFVGLLYF